MGHSSTHVCGAAWKELGCGARIPISFQGVKRNTKDEDTPDNNNPS